MGSERRVHNHGPEEGPGLSCRESLVGDCIRAEIKEAKANARHWEERYFAAATECDDLRREVEMLMARLEEWHGSAWFTDPHPTTNLQEAAQAVHRHLTARAATPSPDGGWHE